MKRYLAFWLGLFVVSGCVTQPELSGAADIRLQLALHYLASGDETAAARQLQRAVQAAPSDYRVHLAQARLLQQQQRHLAATRAYQQAQRLASNNGYVANNYGAFLCALGQYDEAHQQFKRAASAPESDARSDALAQSGYCYLQAKNFTAASVALLKALDADGSQATRLLEEAREQLLRKDAKAGSLLVEIYHQRLSATTESLELQIRFAALQGHAADVIR
ncbi:type IV pilus biogenesis/stability protein PilW [Pantoea sp. A4]|uniref:type IV pilus biogenesis/stability protein PilW n=1 Tax=Pantoea sp. A4 TaxID=1225184 RepID=UPI00036C5148|nr:type IV pilus biogenesis/stability protein PilW [Pantoea sp. A4]